jgi:ATP-binding cassette, subfamily B, bacterial
MREFGELTGEMYKAGYRAAWFSALFLPAVQIISFSVALGLIVWYSGTQSKLAGYYRRYPGFRLISPL